MTSVSPPPSPSPSHQIMHALVGRWFGYGSGSYQDVPPFRYIEETRVEMASDWRMLHVVQKTWEHDGDGVKRRALHLEVGLILAGDNAYLSTVRTPEYRQHLEASLVREPPG